MAENDQGGGSVVAEGDLVVNLGSLSAGGEGGAAILNDITLTLERENTLHHGIGNREVQDHTEGNRTYALDTEAQVNRESYEAIKEMERSGTPAEGMIFDQRENEDSVVEADIGKIVWNQVELATSDGDDVTVSLQADCYEVSL